MGGGLERKSEAALKANLCSLKPGPTGEAPRDRGHERPGGILNLFFCFKVFSG